MSDYTSSRRLPVVILVNPITGEELIWAANTGDEVEVESLKLYWRDSEDVTGVARVKTTSGIKSMYIRVVEKFDDRVMAPRKYNELRNKFTTEIRQE